MSLNTSIKNDLLNHCFELLNKRIENAHKAMDDAQAAANEEEKSTAGDKYDTSRAMSHNLRDMNAKQLNEAIKDLSVLEQIKPELITSSVRLGSIVRTSDATFFLATSIGKIQRDDQTFFVISLQSPIGQAMINKKAGDTFLFNGKSIQIMEVL